MEKSPIQNKNLASDFENLLKNMFKKESADLLRKECVFGNLKIVVDKKLVKEDGETTFEKLDNDSESKKTTVKIKKSVADAVHVCWRMSILLHELLHALHYLSTEEDIFEDQTHGDDWCELFLKVTILFIKVNLLRVTSMLGSATHCVAHTFSLLMLNLMRIYQ